MKIKITEISQDSFWKNEIKEILGMVVTVDEKPEKSFNGEYCLVIPKEPYFRGHGIWCKYIEVPEPSAMSELGKWIEENGKYTTNPVDAMKFAARSAGLDVSTYEYDFNEPKKLTWLQKIRGYDDLQARCNSAESMRDHYKTIMSEALRDRDLHAKVADNWQQRLIDQNEIIGKRLKFSVGHNHVEIVIGNPITLCSNYCTEDKHGDYTDNAISRCSNKDVYDWKKGAVQSLENLCDEVGYSKTLRRDLRKALAKKYPEIFEVTK